MFFFIGNFVRIRYLSGASNDLYLNLTIFRLYRPNVHCCEWFKKSILSYLYGASSVSFQVVCIVNLVFETFVLACNTFFNCLIIGRNYEILFNAAFLLYYIRKLNLNLNDHDIHNFKAHRRFW